MLIIETLHFLELLTPTVARVEAEGLVSTLRLAYHTILRSFAKLDPFDYVCTQIFAKE